MSVVTARPEPIDYIAASIELTADLRKQDRHDTYAAGYNEALKHVGGVLGNALSLAGGMAPDSGREQILAARAGALSLIRNRTASEREGGDPCAPGSWASSP